MARGNRIALVFLFLLLAFSSAAQSNLVSNPGFDQGLSPWSELTSTGSFQWEPFDAGEVPGSGSVRLAAIGSASIVEVGQCIPLPSPATYVRGGRIFIHSSTDGPGEVGVGARFFTSSGCTGSSGGAARIFFRDPPSSSIGRWLALDSSPSSPFTPSPSTMSVQFYVFIIRTGGSQFVASFDDVYLRPAGEALPPPPRISFESSPTQIRRGDSARLLWTVTDATSVSIDPGVGPQPLRGSATVTPASPTTYTLTATGPGGTAARQTTVDVIITPEVAITALPQQMVQGTGAGGATTEYVVTNVGGESTTVTLSREGNFFTESPTSFSLAAGGSQTVTLEALQRDTGSYRGRSILSGNGVPPGTAVPVRLLAVPTPDGPTAAEPESSRVDVAAPEGSNPTATAAFRNTGQAKILGALQSTVPWIVPEEGVIEVDPGQTATVSFTIDRSQRPPNAEIGSLEGKLLLVFRDGPTGKSGGVGTHSGAASSSSVVTVIDTSKPSVQESAIPPLAPGEVALFIPGAGHVQGGAGLFFSDIALINLSGQQNLQNIDLYYTASGTGVTKKASVGTLQTGTPVALADVVRTVFEAEATLGSLMIRNPNISQLSVNANILLRTREDTPRTFGNTIPALRSDRSVGAGESFFLTGLTRTATSHTNLFIQETSGGSVLADIAFYDLGGNKLGERSGVPAGPFQLTGLFESTSTPVLPLGAVSAVITSRAESTGRFAAYATPVDRVSGDSWSLVDWNAQAGFAGNAEMLIPAAGAARGGGGLHFRTDLAVINRGEQQASGILRYIAQPGEGRPPIDRTVTVGPRQSSVLDNVTTSLFGIDPDQTTLGFMKFLPQVGSMTVTSRNFATVGDDPGTFGTGVPTQALDSALRLGEVRRIGGIRDASSATISARVPGSFRSNFAMMETTGEAPVTVRVTVHYSFSGGTKAVARGSGSREYTLQPNQFVQLSRVSREVLGPSRDSFGDFDNLQVDFAVVGGDGAAAVWVSSVENDTGDSILRVD